MYSVDKKPYELLRVYSIGKAKFKTINEEPSLIISEEEIQDSTQDSMINIFMIIVVCLFDIYFPLNERFRPFRPKNNANRNESSQTKQIQNRMLQRYNSLEG